MDKLEPIRAVFRQCGLYNHAADDLLCERLAEAMTPKTCACESVLCMNECECAVRGKAQSDAAVSAKPVAWVHTWEYPGADSLTESFSWKPADEFLRDTVPVPSSIVSSVPLYAAPPAALAEPLFLLHTGAVYGNERGDWEIEANSGKAVDAYCDANPGKTIGLYLATPAQQPAAAVPEPMPPVPDSMGLSREQREVEDAFRRGWNSCRARVMQLNAYALAVRNKENNNG